MILLHVDEKMDIWKVARLMTDLYECDYTFEYKGKGNFTIYNMNVDEWMKNWAELYKEAEKL